MVTSNDAVQYYHMIENVRANNRSFAVAACRVWAYETGFHNPNLVADIALWKFAQDAHDCRWLGAYAAYNLAVRLNSYVIDRYVHGKDTGYVFHTITTERVRTRHLDSARYVLTRVRVVPTPVQVVTGVAVLPPPTLPVQMVLF